MFALVSVFISSCSLPFWSVTPLDWDIAVVHYVWTLDDGTEFDSSRTEWREPFSLEIWKGTSIKWFEDAVKSMKVGQTKKVRLSPEESYGGEFIEQKVPVSEFREVIEEPVSADGLTGVINQPIPTKQAKELFNDPTSWSVDFVKGAEKKIWEATITVLSITDETTILSINDPKAPFYGKELTVGTKTVMPDGTEITILTAPTSTDGEGKTLNVQIKPLYDIVEKTDTHVTYKVKNTHQLAGKYLNFEIELLEIKNTNVTSEPTN